MMTMVTATVRSRSRFWFRVNDDVFLVRGSFRATGVPLSCRCSTVHAQLQPPLSCDGDEVL